MHQNIAGLLNNGDLLALYNYKLMMNDKELDIICVTEHFIKSGHEQLLSINNYKQLQTIPDHTKNEVVLVSS